MMLCITRVSPVPYVLKPIAISFRRERELLDGMVYSGKCNSGNISGRRVFQRQVFHVLRRTIPNLQGRPVGRQCLL